MLKRHSTGLNGHTYLQTCRNSTAVRSLCPGLSCYTMAPAPGYSLTGLFLLLFSLAGVLGRDAPSCSSHLLPSLLLLLVSHLWLCSCVLFLPCGVVLYCGAVHELVCVCMYVHVGVCVCVCVCV